ncbi:MAG: hypothetical protein ACTSRL_22600, partial [Candidatus Helarchaeota archaeon]
PTGNLFNISFTIPTADTYLGQIQLIIRANDTDGGWTEVSLGTVTVLNNQPLIMGELTNQTDPMYRDQTIWTNATVSDVEDSYPGLTAFLCVRYNNGTSWNNQSMGAPTGNLFNIYFTIPTADAYLGQIQLIIRANDTDGGWKEITLGTISVLNNIPVIVNPLSNQTAQMYRNDTIWMNATILDVEDLPTVNLTAFLCVYLNSSSWYNVSMLYFGSFVELNWTIPDADQFNGLIHLYLRVNDTDSGVASVLLGAVEVIGRPTEITIYLNGTMSLYMEINIDENINVTAYYNETQGGNPLVDADLRISCLTNPAVAQNILMDNLGSGYYNWTFHPISGGQFIFEINATRSGFASQLIQFTILVRGTTNFTIYLNGTVANYYELYFDEVLNITTFYFNETNKAGITGATLNLTMQVNNSYYAMTERGNGNYSWIFDASVWYQTVSSLPYNFLIKINATHPSFQYFEAFITIRIKSRPTALIAYLNDTILSDQTIYYGESLQITAYYEDILKLGGVAAASVNISGTPMTEDLVEIGNYTSIFQAVQLGDFTFRINASRYGYAYNETWITIHVVARLTGMKLYVDGMQTSTTSIYYNESLLITAYYYDIISGIGIPAAFVNLTGGVTWNMNAVPSQQGNYSLLYNASIIGNLIFTINASRYGYQFNSTTLNLTVMERLMMINTYANGTLTYNYSIYLNQTVDFIFQYYDILRGIGVENAVVNLTIQTSTWSLSEQPVGSGNYTITYNATSLGSYLLIINASRYGYQFNSTEVYLQVLRRPVVLDVSLNATLGTEITIRVGESVEIALSFKDALTGQGIAGALINISWNPSYTGYTDAGGNFTFRFNGTIPGIYLIHVHVEKDGYTLLDQTITVHVKSLPQPPQDFMWIVYLILALVGAIGSVSVLRARRRKMVEPIVPKEPEKKRRLPTFEDLLKVKFMVLMQRTSNTPILMKHLHSVKVNKRDRQEFLKILPALKPSTLDTRIITQQNVQILYYDDELLRTAFLIEDRPSTDFHKALIEFTKIFEQNFKPQLKELPENLSIFEGGLATELQDLILNFQMLAPQKVRKDKRFLRTLPDHFKKIVRIAIELEKKQTTFLLFDLLEKCQSTLSLTASEIITAINELWELGIFHPDITITAEEQAKIEEEKEEIRRRLEEEQQNKLKNEIEKAKIAALEKMQQEKYVEAAIYYQMAADAAKKLEQVAEYEEFLRKGEECLEIKRAMIEKLETKERKKKAPEQKEKSEELGEELTEEAIEEKLKEIIESAETSYVNIIYVAQEIGISVAKIRELAKKLEYRVTKSRIYKEKK